MQPRKNTQKYELTSETKTANARTLHRIKALVSFGKVEQGQLGGWVETEHNLSHVGDAWVYDGAEVYGNARVSGNACVSGNAVAATAVVGSSL